MTRNWFRKSDPDAPAVEAPSLADRWKHAVRAAEDSFPDHPDASERSAREALDISREYFGMDHPRTIRSMMILVKCLATRRETGEAEDLADELIRAVSEHHGEEHQEYADTLLTLGTLFWNCGNPKKAESIFRKSVPAVESSFGRRGLNYFKALKGLAVTSDAIGRYDTEQWALRRLMKYARYTNNSELVPLIEAQMAASRAACGDLEDAEDLSKKLWNRWALPKGSFAAEAAGSYLELANFCAVAGRMETARIFCLANVRTLGTWRKMNSPELLPGLRTLFEVYMCLDDEYNAEQTAKRAHGIRVKEFFSKRPTGNSLADDELVIFLLRKGKHTAAEEVIEDEIGKCRKRFGPDSLKESILYFNLGHLHLKLLMHAAAESSFEKAIEIGSRHFPGDDPRNAHLLAGLGAAHYFTDRLIEARRDLRRALDLLSRNEGADPEILHGVLFNLGRTEREVGNPAAAELYFNRLRQIQEENSQLSYEWSSKLLVELGITLNGLHRYDEAGGLFDELVRFADADDSPIHVPDLDLAAALKMLADYRMYQKRPSSAEKHYIRSIGIYESSGNEASGWLAGCFEGMARIKLDSGAPGEGEEYLSRAIRIYEVAGGVSPDHLESMRSFLERLKQVKNPGGPRFPGEGSGGGESGSVH
jgi:tetratricopeptide (TPR) repeat protein